jgi:hypothetical protein
LTLEPEAGAASRPSYAAGRYENFAELRAEHLKLRESFSETVRGPGAALASSELRGFLTKAQKTGAVLADPNMRKAAQGILYYWNAELACLADARKEDFVPIILAAPELSALRDAERATVEIEPAMEDNKADQRALIRLAATARQWRDSGKQSGYLLAGKTIEEAARFADQDPNLAEFIRASGEGGKKRRRLILAGASSVSLASLVTLFFWQFSALPTTGERLIREVGWSTSGEVQQRKLWWLAILQPWLPPYDFSGTPKISHVTLPNFRMWAPNFTGVAFVNVSFPNARLPAASFSTSTFLVDDPKKDNKNDFTGADLTFSQYLRSQIYSTSFAGADLYRAAFDKAMLCDVDFSHADLRNASFFATSLDDKTYASLRKTVWWIAAGWNSSHLKKLLDSPGPSQPNPASPSGTYQSANATDVQAARQGLRRSARFCKDVGEPIAEAAPDTFERADALNNMAWTLAAWGIDRDNPPPGDNCHVKGLPKDALAAADQAIGVILDLKNKGQTKLDYAYHLSNFRDTKAYILMQTDRMKEAKELYEIDPAQTAADPGRLFRYAVTLFGAGQESEADKAFKDAFEQQYLPTGELQNLKQYIPLPAREMAFKVLDDTYPSPKGIPLCPTLREKPN